VESLTFGFRIRIIASIHLTITDERSLRNFRVDGIITTRNSRECTF